MRTTFRDSPGTSAASRPCPRCQPCVQLPPLGRFKPASLVHTVTVFTITGRFPRNTAQTDSGNVYGVAWFALALDLGTATLQIAMTSKACRKLRMDCNYLHYHWTPSPKCCQVNSGIVFAVAWFAQQALTGMQSFQLLHRKPRVWGLASEPHLQRYLANFRSLLCLWRSSIIGSLIRVGA